jgi:hypothetical protein
MLSEMGRKKLCLCSGKCAKIYLGILFLSSIFVQIILGISVISKVICKESFSKYPRTGNLRCKIIKA